MGTQFISQNDNRLGMTDTKFKIPKSFMKLPEMKQQSKRLPLIVYHCRKEVKRKAVDKIKKVFKKLGSEFYNQNKNLIKAIRGSKTKKTQMELMKKTPMSLKTMLKEENRY